jgi:hypothetical protein
LFGEKSTPTNIFHIAPSPALAAPLPEPKKRRERVFGIRGGAGVRKVG